MSAGSRVRASVFVYAVRQGCALCKSLAGASSQPGGQTKKQMDWFGLNPSHAILSSGPPPPLVHPPPCPLVQPARHALQNERRAATECCAAPGGGGGLCLMLLVPGRDGQEDRG